MELFYYSEEPDILREPTYYMAVIFIIDFTLDSG